MRNMGTNMSIAVQYIALQMDVNRPGGMRRRKSFLPPLFQDCLLALFLFLPPLGLPSGLVPPGLPGLARAAGELTAGVLTAGVLAAGVLAAGALAVVGEGALAVVGTGPAFAGLTTNRLDFCSFFLPHECIAWMIRLPMEPETRRKVHLGIRETML